MPDLTERTADGLAEIVSDDTKGLGADVVIGMLDTLLKVDLISHSFLKSRPAVFHLSFGFNILLPISKGWFKRNFVDI